MLQEVIDFLLLEDHLLEDHHLEEEDQGLVICLHN
jgi:hypothetical protein